MSFSVQYAGNGNFNMTVNGQQQTFNLADLNTMLRMEQVAQYDQGIADQLGEIQKTNQKRKALNFLLSKARQFKSEGKTDGYKTSSDGIADDPSLEFEVEGFKAQYANDGTNKQGIRTWMIQFGMDVGANTQINSDTSKTDRDAKWDTLINNLKTNVDNITSDSEMQMLRFRQMVDKRGTALQEAKTTLSNDKRLKDAIIQG